MVKAPGKELAGTEVELLACHHPTRDEPDAYGVTNIAAELRAHALQVNRLLAKLGILKQ
jgi:hypothetical protein